MTNYDKILNQLQPKEFFKWFLEICKIPHGSKNESQLVNYIVAFAKERNIEYCVDQVGNVFMKLPATKGYENQGVILFQAHLDMVCVKDQGVEFDFEKDAINLEIVDDKLCAKGTSLGADNGVGVATMLALANSKQIAHPPLELVFTVDEETGLNGIRDFDVSKITARRMINMDCGDSHVLAVSSMGKKEGEIDRKFVVAPMDNDSCALKITVDGGLGGHASLRIRDGRACAVNCLANLLCALSSFSVQLALLQTKGVAIFNHAEMVISVPVDHKQQIIDCLKESFTKIKTIYEKTDPNINLSIVELDEKLNVIDNKSTMEIADLLCQIKTAPYREDGLDNSILLTLSVLSDVGLIDGKFNFKFYVRSSLDVDLGFLFDFYSRTAKRLGFEVNIKDAYSGWREVDISPFREKAIKVHKNIFGNAPMLERVQGGIETAIILQKINDMDAIGFAPTARGAHSTKECIHLLETPDYWKWLIELLAHKE